ncbi:hypothetical protein [Acidovorax sp. BLS4]|uniref:hypothetical protein n=1 Tax=Acidovorax sp. BLS4 TaxID=3273430 RepID=UPI002943D40B|nr:hypothetical protein [Paracidovorax avenae]WOI46484.1 hypothetical protein R1Z03_04510 [Paracidovorax avenae]
MSNETTPDYVREAAFHLRHVAEQHGHKLRSATAHELIAGYFGFKSTGGYKETHLIESLVFMPAHGAPKTMMIEVPVDGVPSPDEQFPHHIEPNVPSLERAIAKVGSRAGLDVKDALWLARGIQTGLAPACMSTGVKSIDNLPVYDTDDVLIGFGSSVAVNRGEFSTCHCCGPDRLYPSSEMYPNGLCREHRDEFTLDAEEAQDHADFAEYHRNR